MRAATNIVIVCSFFWLLVSFWNRNDLPVSIDYVAAVADEPQQSTTPRHEFSAAWDGTEYQVNPEYDYELVGLIVSFRHHDNNSRMHRLADDHLNMLDVCVIWGDNTTEVDLEKLKFWNGIFTCNVSTRDQQTWDAFNIYQLSNNHLISDDASIRDKVRDIHVGDQIRVRGVLASYDSPGGRRGTSTTRMDTGDGACETIYVEDFEIIRPAKSFWRTSMWLSLCVLLLGLLRFFLRPFKSHLA